MNAIRKTITIACAMLSLGLASSSNMAYAADQQGIGGHAGHAAHGGFGPHRASPEQLQAHRAKRLAALHDKLNLRSDQEAAWNEFVAATTPPARPNLAERRAEFADLNAPERAQKMLDQMKLREATMSKHVEALKTFYAQLSSEQQKTFDENFKRMAHRRGGLHQG